MHFFFVFCERARVRVINWRAPNVHVSLQFTRSRIDIACDMRWHAHGIPGTPHTIHTSAQCKRLIGQNFLRSRTVPPITCTLQRHSPEYVVKSCVWSVSKWNNHNPGNLTKFYTEMKLHGKFNQEFFQCILWQNLDEDSFDMLYKNDWWAAILTLYERPVYHYMKEKRICYHPLITISWFFFSILRDLGLNLRFLF